MKKRFTLLSFILIATIGVLFQTCKKSESEKTPDATANIKITAPISTSNWPGSTMQTITWTSEVITGNVKIELMHGSSLSKLIETSTLNTGTYAWLIPEDLVTGVDYKIKITSLNSSDILDESDSFTITSTAQTIILTTTALSNITSTTAICGGNITSDGGSSIISRGVCWSTTPNPTIANFKTIDGAGIGIYTSSLTGLTDKNVYYVRAYATNLKETVYGSEIDFVATISTPPVISVSADKDNTTPGTDIIFTLVMGTQNLELTKFTVNGIAPIATNITTSPAGKWDAVNNKFVSNVQNVTVTYKVTIGAGVAIGSIVPFNFTVTDKEGLTASVYKGITVISSGGTQMGTEHSGTIYNYLSNLKSGWDMVSDVQVSGSATSGKDIWNHTSTTDADYNNTYGFTPAIWTASSTDMVKVNLDYATATAEQVTAAYTSGSKVVYYNLTMSGYGSVFVLRLRGGNTYAILKVTGVIGVAKTTPQDDNITFVYKKTI